MDLAESPNLQVLVLTIVAVFLTSIVLALTTRFFFRKDVRVVNVAVEELLEIRKSSSRGEGDPQQILRHESKVPRAFIYLDSQILQGMYNQLQDAGTVPTERELKGSVASELSGGLKAKALELKAGRKGENSASAKYLPETDPDRIYRLIERNLLEQGELEAVDLLGGIDVGPLEAMERSITRFAKEREFTVPDEALSLIRRAWEDQQFKAGVDRMSKLRGYVAIAADFAPTTTEAGDVVLRGATTGTPPAEVVAHCVEVNLRTSGKAALATSNFRGTCVGIVSGWNNEKRSLTVRPIAIF
ncbi:MULTISPECIES: hypothetical protein [unclassified Streptomyces]|uniref:hypothetical protein n=1 Tax=unclassified Streptomyces TaxID=2593676 RepID=UPI000AC46267|nr:MULTISPECIES: hypothetical protein [unclassified Streptomyces]